ncbi:MAG: hypothetical protein ACXWQ6_09300 [Candidatus Limnocylindrales bacterium]|jgi:hypothetical protein
MSEHHDESGAHRGERRAHDAAARHNASQTQTPPYHWVSKRNGTIVSAIAVILIVSMTFLFVAGFIRW